MASRVYDPRAPKRAAFWSLALACPLFLLFAFLASGILIEGLYSPKGIPPDTYLFSSILLLTGYALFRLVRWLLRMTMLPPTACLVWLRKFDRENSSMFRLSRAVDLLGRDGVCTITLEDASFQQSRPQRRRLWMAAFWTILGFITAVLIGIGLMPGLSPYSPRSLADVGFLASAWAASVPISLMLAWLLTSKLGSSRQLSFADVRAQMDTYWLRPRGAWLFRVRDEWWRQSVLHALKEADAILVDVSAVTEHIKWEIEQALQAAPRDRIVLLIDEEALKDPNALARLHAHVPALEGQVSQALAYPATRASAREAAAFQVELRNTVIAALTNRETS